MQIKPALNVKITVNVNTNNSKTKKNVTFILNVLSENGIIFAWMGSFWRPKKCYFNKNVFKTRLRAHT